MDRQVLRTALIAVFVLVCAVQFSESEHEERERRDVSAVVNSKSDLVDLENESNVRSLIDREHNIVKRGARFRRCRYGRRRSYRVRYRKRYGSRRIRRIYRRRRFRVRRRRFRVRRGRIRRRFRKRVRVRIHHVHRPRPLPILHPLPPVHPISPPVHPLPPPAHPLPPMAQPLPIHPLAVGTHGCLKPCGLHAHCDHGSCICDFHCEGNPYLGCHVMKK